MALSERGCRHGGQIGKCVDCDLDYMTMAAGAEASRVNELTALRKQDDALILQLVEALDDGEEHTAQCKNHWYVGCDCNKTAALTAARARLKGKL